MLVVPRLHRAAAVGVVRGPERQGLAPRAREAEDADRGVPVVHDKHVLALAVQGQVAGRGAARAGAGQLGQAPAPGADLPGDDLPGLGHGLRARVEHVLARVEAGEGRVHCWILGDGQQHHLPVAGIHVEGVEAPRCLGPARPVGQVVEARVAGDDDQLLELRLHAAAGRHGCSRRPLGPAARCDLVDRRGDLDDDAAGGALHG
mmetsp:Transcript_111901/g.316575  ORF Transcript_111901/g.316575 Transcript_111901/m.316575 type:complete len:204 (+) Transcript_111901:788-1399(+)